MVEAEGLSENPRYGESVFSAISVGVFFILVGAIFVTTPNLFNKILDFFRDFIIVRAPNTVIFLPAPDSPSAHLLVYSAVTKYSFAWSFFQILVLTLRFFAGSPLSKKAETVSNLVFWLGTSLLTSQFLNETVTVTAWFVFWSGIIILCGVSLIIRGVILAIRM
jgi:hypothetical protein